MRIARERKRRGKKMGCLLAHCLFLIYIFGRYSSGDVSKIPLNLLTHLSLFCIEFNSNGELTEVQRFTSVASTVIASAHASGVKVS